MLDSTLVGRIALSRLYATSSLSNGSLLDCCLAEWYCLLHPSCFSYRSNSAHVSRLVMGDTLYEKLEPYGYNHGARYVELSRLSRELVWTVISNTQHCEVRYALVIARLLCATMTVGVITTVLIIKNYYTFSEQ